MPLISPDLDALRQPDEPSVTWNGHATLLFQHDGKNILTDPVFSDMASPFSFSGPKRVVPAALQPEHLPDLDLMIIFRMRITTISICRVCGDWRQYSLPSGSLCHSV